jgi:hypothetical protein
LLQEKELVTELELDIISKVKLNLQKTLLLCGVFCLVLSCSDNLHLNIEIESGLIEGYESEDGTIKFLGIPYAEPPLENLRWKPPVKKLPWSGTLKTVEPEKACSQPTNDRTGNNAFYKLILQESGLDLSSLEEVSGFDEVSELNMPTQSTQH